MRTGKLLVVPLLLLVVLPSAAPAGIIFGRKPQPPANPAEHVRELLATVQSSPDERKVVSAIDELQTYDAATYPQIVAVLSESLRRDPRFGVRLEAAQTLGRIRPMSQQAGQALEDALNDGTMRVRWQARTSLMWYYTAGFNSRKQDLSATNPGNGKENPRPETVPNQPTVTAQPTLPTPVSPAQVSVPPASYGNVPRPLPRGPNQQVIVNRPSTVEPPLGVTSVPEPVTPSAPAVPTGPVFPQPPVAQPLPLPAPGPALPPPPQDGGLPLGPALPPQLEVPSIPVPPPAQPVPPGNVSQGPVLPPPSGEPPLPGVPVGQPGSRPVPPPASVQTTGPISEPLPEF